MKNVSVPAQAWPWLCLVHFIFFTVSTNSFGKSDPQSWYTENKGQIVDQFGRPLNDVKFIYVAGDFKLILKKGGFSYELLNQSTSSGVEEATGSIPSFDEDERVPDAGQTISVSRVDVSFHGCNANAVISADEAAGFYQNFYNVHTGHKGVTGVRSFKKIIYKDIYPDIDLVFSINNDAERRPEYSFIIHPGSDARKIQLDYKGTNNSSIGAMGELYLKTKQGFICESKPIGFYADNPISQVPVSFAINGQRVSFLVSARDKSKAFIIDPVISWATYFGGSRLDMADEMAINNNNDIYVTGRTASTNMITVSGGYQSTYGGGNDDAFLVKFDTDGNLLWATYYGGSKTELGYCMTIDNTDHPIICGKTNSTSGIASPGAIQPAFGGGEHDSYIAKFNDDGTLQWSTYYGGENMDRVLACTTDKFGTIYLTGYTESLTHIATPGAFKTTGDLNGETFIMKITSAGGLQFCTYFGEKGQDRGHSINVDDWGNIITTGTTNSKSGIVTAGAWQTVYGGKIDIYMNKLTNSGEVIWSTYIGGTKDDRGRASAVDAAGNIYILAQTQSTDISTTPGVFKPVFTPAATNDQDAVLAKFDSSGQRIWTTYYGGTGNEQPKSLKTDRFGSYFYISGSTKSKSGLATNDAYQKKMGGANDAFFARINHNASTLMYSSYYGGKKSESDFNGTWYGAPLELDRQGNLILASATQSPDSIAFGNPHQSTIASDSAFDFFVVKFAETCFDSYENNDDFIVNAPRLFYDGTSASRTVKATLQSSDDVDYYQFILPAGLSNIRCTVSGVTAQNTITIYDAEQSEVASASSPPGANGAAILNFAIAGTYYVGVAANGSPFTGPQCYELDIETSDIPFKESRGAGKNNFSFDVSPNPATEIAVITWNETGESAMTLEVMNGAGQLMWRREISALQTSFELDLETFPAGPYFIRMSKGDQRFSEIIVRQ